MATPAEYFLIFLDLGYFAHFHAQKGSRSGLINDQQIFILPLPYFLASKLVAFNDRGAIDPRTSHDFEDIVYILDNRMDLVDQLIKASSDVKPYLIEQFQNIMNNPVKQEAIYGNLIYETREERYRMLIDKLEKFIYM